MHPRFSSLLSYIGALALLFVAFTFLTSRPVPTAVTLSQVTEPSATTSAETASVGAATGAATSTATATKKAVATTTVVKAASQPAPTPAASPSSNSKNEVTRVQNPYPFAPLSWADVNANARGALVNILCMPQGGSLSPISGSGVIIDPRGVILTNAHVGQYVLLSESSQVDLVCTIRTGSPAVSHYKVTVLYIPPAWVQQHVGEITTPHPLGTGEHDYALLLITGSTDGSPLPATFPALPYDARKGVAFQGDQVLAASYPAEFLGGLAAESSLYSASSISSVEQLLTFSSGTPDVLSLGGIIEAQSGSSGGAVANAWGRLVGLIVTTSQGETTSQRDLHALSLFYIDSDLAAQTGSGLAATLSGDLAAKAQDFTSSTAPSLVRQYIKVLTK